MTWQYKKNVYTCEKCGHKIVTIDRDYGVTPFMTTCPVCDGFSRSSCYHVDQNIEPKYEWYTPSSEEIKTLSIGSKEHVKMGGLILREIKDTPSKEGR